jgi:Tfp pilus assembly protein PilF
MSLLGLVYLEDGEGAEIALALCEKGVELNMASTAARLRLAKVQLQCDLLVEARKNLTKCLGDRRLEGDVRACMAEVWQKLGRKKQAERWLAKVA